MVFFSLTTFKDVVGAHVDQGLLIMFCSFDTILLILHSFEGSNCKISTTFLKILMILMLIGISDCLPLIITEVHLSKGPSV